jgi:2-amino-4-hydroxy-6-hydroxymethyldihydropteridine diphosphokinase
MKLPASVSTTTLYVGAGTNLGDRVQNLIDARLLLEHKLGASALSRSSMYISSPVGYLNQANFINCVFRLELAQQDNQPPTVASVLEHLQRIESNLGRVRDPNNQNAARIIDLDILAYGDLQCAEAHLTVPHPRINQRLFVLLPLLELNPDLSFPGIGRLDTLLEIGRSKGYFDDQKIYKLGE